MESMGMVGFTKEASAEGKLVATGEEIMIVDTTPSVVVGGEEVVTLDNPSQSVAITGNDKVVTGDNPPSLEADDEVVVTLDNPPPSVAIAGDDKVLTMEHPSSLVTDAEVVVILNNPPPPVTVVGVAGGDQVVIVDNPPPLVSDGEMVVTLDNPSPPVVLAGGDKIVTMDNPPPPSSEPLVPPATNKFKRLPAAEDKPTKDLPVGAIPLPTDSIVMTTKDIDEINPGDGKVVDDNNPELRGAAAPGSRITSGGSGKTH